MSGNLISWQKSSTSSKHRGVRHGVLYITGEQTRIVRRIVLESNTLPKPIIGAIGRKLVYNNRIPASAATLVVPQVLFWNIIAHQNVFQTLASTNELLDYQDPGFLKILVLDFGLPFFLVYFEWRQNCCCWTKPYGLYQRPMDENNKPIMVWVCEHLQMSCYGICVDIYIVIFEYCKFMECINASKILVGFIIQKMWLSINTFLFMF